MNSVFDNTTILINLSNKPVAVNKPTKDTINYDNIISLPKDNITIPKDTINYDNIISLPKDNINYDNIISLPKDNITIPKDTNIAPTDEDKTGTKALCLDILLDTFYKGEPMYKNFFANKTKQSNESTDVNYIIKNFKSGYKLDIDNRYEYRNQYATVANMIRSKIITVSDKMYRVLNVKDNTTFVTEFYKKDANEEIDIVRNVIIKKDDELRTSTVTECIYNNKNLEYVGEYTFPWNQLTNNTMTIVYILQHSYILPLETVPFSNLQHDVYVNVNSIDKNNIYKYFDHNCVFNSNAAHFIVYNNLNIINNNANKDQNIDIINKMLDKLNAINSTSKYSETYSKFESLVSAKDKKWLPTLVCLLNDEMKIKSDKDTSRNTYVSQVNNKANKINECIINHNKNYVHSELYKVINNKYNMEVCYDYLCYKQSK